MKTGKSINCMDSTTSVLENTATTQSGNGLPKSSNAFPSQLSSTAPSSAFMEDSLLKSKLLTRLETSIDRKIFPTMDLCVICCGLILLMMARKVSTLHPEEQVTAGETTLVKNSVTLTT
jgi:hypothetical protein